LYNDNTGDIDTQAKQAENEFDEKHNTQVPTMQQNSETEPLWNMAFNGSCGKTRSGVRMWLYNLTTNQAQSYYYKIIFLCTNNIAEYEALLLGLKFLKKKRAKRIFIQEDSKLIIRQIKGQYSAKHPRLRVSKCCYSFPQNF